MCTRQKIIFPRYSKRPMYVKCGHCPACLQEKAAKRVRRINDTSTDDRVWLMVALTYSRGTAPYVLRSEAYDFSNGVIDNLNVYRDCSIRKVRKPDKFNDYNQCYKRRNETVVLDNIEFVCDTNLLKTKDLKYEHGKIGVVYYRDYQGFMARLRLNLKRHYQYTNPLYSYACSEFGVRSDRPHYHVLISCEKSAETFVRSAIFESWPFSDLSRFPRAVERAYKAASYVASYVNQSTNFPSFFKTYFKPKHSYSKGFGVLAKKYSLSSILEKFERGSLKFSVARSDKGFTRVTDVPFPKYVINRYFPVFKGYTRCSPRSLLSYMERICSGSWKLEYFPHEPLGYAHETLYLSADECRKFAVRLNNAYKRYCANVPDGYSKKLEDYLQMHINIWNCYHSTVLRLHLENPDISQWEKYDNLDDVNSNHRLRAMLGLLVYQRLDGLSDSERLDAIASMFEPYFSVTDPNQYESVVMNTWKYETSFHDHIKHKNVSNEIYLQSDKDCEL